MKKILTLIAVMVMTISAQAQIVSSRSVSRGESANYTRWYASYASYSWSASGTSESFSGARLGFLKGISVSEDIPLYVEAGLNGQANGGKDCTFIMATVPVNVAYKYQISDDFAVAPHAGIHFTGNIYGDGPGGDFYAGESDAQRFQYGLQIGAGIVYSKLYIGAEYAFDLNKWSKNANLKTSNFYVNLGIQF